jgi:hypothetical protein
VTSGRHWRAMTGLLAAAVVTGTLSAAFMPGLAAAPLMPEGSRPPGAAAHGDDTGQEQPAPLVQSAIIAAQADPTDDSGSAIPASLRVPIGIEVPDLGIESDVVHVGLDPWNHIVVPEDVLLTGWYDGSRRLDARMGSTVIVGHRDSATQGSGALYGIEELDIGSSITVIGRDGTPYDFTVDSVELIDKSLLPQEASRIFTREGPYRLVLVTCGGAFDTSAGSYLANVVVTAVPDWDTASQQ